MVQLYHLLLNISFFLELIAHKYIFISQDYFLQKRFSFAYIFFIILKVNQFEFFFWFLSYLYMNQLTKLKHLIDYKLQEIKKTTSVSTIKIWQGKLEIWFLKKAIFW